MSRPVSSQVLAAARPVIRTLVVLNIGYAIGTV